MKFGLAVTLFSPNVNQINWVANISSQFDVCVAYDNTDGGIDVLYSKVLNDAGIFLISNGINEGLSIAYNEMLTFLSNITGVEFALVLDQDSNFDIAAINKAINIIKEIDSPKIGVYCPNVLYLHSKKNDSLNFPTVKRKTVHPNKAVTVSVSWCISSGSFIKLPIYKEIGGFDNAYFIDRIDKDYCKRLILAGYKIEMLLDVYLFQSLGNVKHLFFFKTFEHTSLRNYYIARNRIYYFRKFNDGYAFFKILLLTTKHILKVLLFESYKLKKLYMIYNGVRDAMLGKFGKIS